MYKILSLDGGGSWSLLQLLTLKDRYPDKTGHAILKEFDMVIANSGGSIILAALVEDWPLDKAIALFKDQKIREKIFSKNSFWERFFPVDYIKSIGPKYSSKRKGKAFRELFTESAKRQMNELPDFIGKPDLKLIVCTYDALNNRAKFFRSYGGGPYYDSVKLTQAIHGSSNAPIQYFDFPARFKAKNSEVFFELWDGALGGFNNPIAAGVIEAIKSGVPRDSITLVSLGTSNKSMSNDDKKTFYDIKQTTIKQRRKKYKFWLWKPQLQFFKMSIVNQAKTILYEPPDWSNYVAFMFLFGEDYKEGLDAAALKRFIRLSPMIHTDKNTLPEMEELLNTLYRMDMNLTKDEEIQKLEECYAGWKEGKIPNQPIEYSITRENELLPTFGHIRYNDGINDWKI
ncbi:MAG: hypothetical protein DCE86_02475 [Flavobacteriaceae bacterium]|uniref:patatin-like phospholipase family protein n=1 Tax=Flavobacterium sp. Leaf359 TaxID=1736351 RepID=UPI0006F78F10|nr:patatin-like phospholipase family protein [Flavobacterium sp. Leaf359]KQS45860.1 hypothetical protein ASG38_14690 [Flavobacterium sp. Leaf359]PZO34288.1 MAG: hypothetical protein DCE86_02475 [Flavobacteriaceae bacterium]